MKIVKKVFLKALSHPFYSRLFGRFTRVKKPKFFAKRVIKYYISIFDIDLQDVKKPLNEFECLSDFFIRELKEGTREIDFNPDIIVSPTDSLLLEVSKISENGKVFQIKGSEYSMESLVKGFVDIEKYKNGDYFQLYLSPRDYHRIHFPFDCKVKKVFYIPGKLLPVNLFSLENFKEVFNQNERVLLILEKEGVEVLCVLVGAYNVGRIVLSFTDFITNDRFPRKPAPINIEGLTAKKGEELGMFMMGSTVLLFFPEKTVYPLKKSGDYVKVGMPIAKWL
ncbi:phosphatidylserine decarboxylase [Thermotomaculum hydrothermale]|uniref:phosphatidylserine decarboxylase n=1 Tax=Thermotomaculum hydrothermale TaxID=981385 RepID=A0A7R6PT12_9BACT|nr:archaetidylserine decarboxylase [Thermotomaculum hydrothermale]BBB32082.1 phosphatidylserine decarboxylase [Thermotomaculum hydrothermale]